MDLIASFLGLKRKLSGRLISKKYLNGSLKSQKEKNR